MFTPKPRNKPVNVKFNGHNHKIVSKRADNYAEMTGTNRSIHKYLMMTSDRYEESQKSNKEKP